MRSSYPKRAQVHWDTLNVEYPVRQFPSTTVSSETIGRRYLAQPIILTELKQPEAAIKEYLHDYNITKELNRSQSAVDFVRKTLNKDRFNKNTACTENQYIYPSMKRMADQPPQVSVNSMSEMRDAYTAPLTPARIVTHKNQFKHPTTTPEYCLAAEEWRKERGPLDISRVGLEKYLDPYVSTTQLYHRPYTRAQLDALSNRKDIVTHYTYADVPWTRTRKPDPGEWWLSKPKHKTVYDRKVFHEDLIPPSITNKPNWVPGAFRTEIRDNYKLFTSNPGSRLPQCEHGALHIPYQRIAAANIPTRHKNERMFSLKYATTESSHIGSGLPLCAVLNQYTEKNKRIK